MNPLDLASHPLWALVFACAVFAAMWILAKALLCIQLVGSALTPEQSRFGCLDGLRGVLALGVFVHHAVVGYLFQINGTWLSGNNPVVNHLGETTVALFFMITGFLFTEKACAPNLSWRHFWVSRLARLFPLYAGLVIAAFLVVLAESGWELQVSVPSLLGQFFCWMTFVIFGRPEINAVPMSWTRIAGVNWSLQYEALFYLVGVPLLHLTARRLGPRQRLALALALLALPLALALTKGTIGGPPLYVAHFLCGIVAAHVYDDPALRPVWSRLSFRFAGGACAVGLCLFPNAWSFGPVILSFAIFLATVGGGSGFGLLQTRAARWLGDISYGIYLLHGLVLWLAFKALRAMTGSVELSLPAYLVFVMATGTVVVLAASCSYMKLEKPIIDFVRSKHKATSV